MPRTSRHYLRTYRLRSGLKQRDVAYLTGQTPSQVSRQEAHRSWPSTRNLLIASIIYDAPVESIVPSYMTELESKVQKKAYMLYRRLRHRHPTRQLAARLQTIKRLATQKQYTDF